MKELIKKLKKLLKSASGLSKLDLTKVNSDLKINYKYWKQIEDSINNNNNIY